MVKTVDIFWGRNEIFCPVHKGKDYRFFGDGVVVGGFFALFCGGGVFWGRGFLPSSVAWGYGTLYNLTIY